MNLEPEVWIRNGKKLYMWTWHQWEYARNKRRDEEWAKRPERPKGSIFNSPVTNRPDGKKIPMIG